MKTRVRLINGKYHPEDGLNLLLSMINEKINFHELKILSEEERGLEISKESKDKIEYFSKMARQIYNEIDRLPNLDEYEMDIEANMTFIVRKKQS